MNKNIYIPIYLASFIMLSFFVIKTLVLLGFVIDSHIIDWYEFFSVILFAPNFIFIIKEMVNNQLISKKKKRAVEDLLDKSCLVYKTDKKGNFIEVNDNFCITSGYKKHELLGKNHSILESKIFSLVDDDYGQSQSVEKYWKDIRETTVKYKETWHEVVTGKAKDESRYIVRSWIKSDFNKNKDFIGFTSVQQDITKLLETSKIISDQEIEVSNVLNAINKSNAVIEFCPGGNIITANENFLNIFGYKLEEIQRKHHHIFVKEDLKNSKKYEKFWEDIKGGKFKAGDFVRLNSNGEEVFISGTYNPILDAEGNCIKVLKVVYDITEIIKQKEEIEKTNSYLEYAAKILRHDMHSGIHTYMPRGLSSLKRSINLNLNKNEIKKLNIDSSLKLLEEGLKHSQKVYDGVKEFTNIVKKDSTMIKSPYNLKYLLKSYLETTAYVDQVTIEELIYTNVNGPLFCTAIDNLIRNGLKYNDSKIKSIRLYMDKKKYNKKSGSYKYVLIVEDNGRGMSQKDFDELSRPYIRRNKQKEQGSGLGLNICMAIMREHNFNVSCTKTIKGTKIKIELPL